MAAAAPNATPPKQGGFRAWINKRLPVDEFVESQLTGYFAPKNFNLWYFFGAFAMLVFVIMIIFSCWCFIYGGNFINSLNTFTSINFH